MRKFIFVSLILAAGTVAHAEGEKHPCASLKKACEAAGFQVGKAKEGKGLFKDCMQKLAKGESVPGVNVSVDEIAACKAKHQEHKEKKESK
jgi:ribosome maturation protein Sdo1